MQRVMQLFMPGYFLIGYVAGFLFTTGYPAPACMLLVTIVWFGLCSMYVIWKFDKQKEFENEIRSILKEKGY